MGLGISVIKKFLSNNKKYNPKANKLRILRVIMKKIRNQMVMKDGVGEIIKKIKTHKKIKARMKMTALATSEIPPQCIWNLSLQTN